MRYTKEVRKTESDLKKRSHKISGGSYETKNHKSCHCTAQFSDCSSDRTGRIYDLVYKGTDRFSGKSLRDVKNEHSVQDSSDTADTSDHIVSSSCHHFLFVGDSRTVGMEEAMQDSDDADTCSYIGKVGEGYYWLVNEGIDQLRTSLSKEPDATVVFNLGVNDLSEIDRYLAFYPQIFAEYPDASFYIMSVNPVGDACSGASNEEIRDFNAKLKESFPDQYLDCYDYLEQNGFSTVDDLHYTNDTYRAIHDYTVSAISEMENP